VVNVYLVGNGSTFKQSLECLTHIAKFSPKVSATVSKVKTDALDTGSQIKTADSMQEIYRDARGKKGKVMICDLGKASERNTRIARCLKNGFSYLAERPSALRREDHLRQKKMAEEADIRWMVDHHERENPVVRRALQICSNEDVQSVQAFCQNSKGILTALKKYPKNSVRGGDVLTSMNHLIYGLDFVDVNTIKSAEAEFYLPASPDSLMSLDGGRKFEVDKRTATAQSKAELEGDGSLTMHSGLLGASKEAHELASEIESGFGYNPINTQIVQAEGKAVKLEDARFFKVEGSRTLFGDLANGKILDLDSKEEIDPEPDSHSPLYRLLEKACMEAEGHGVFTVPQKERERFSKLLFDIRERFDGSFENEINQSNKKLQAVKIK
jgi:hypothetical protein